MTDFAVEWKNVSYAVPNGFWLKPKPIISDLEISLKKGYSLGIMGDNGAGKTTSLKLGVGLIRPCQGQVLINGKSVTHPDTKQRIGFLSEHQYIYPHLRLGEWLSMLGRLSGVSHGDLQRRLQEVLDLLALGKFEKTKMKVLSKGQIQRAGFAQAILHDPDILFLDEPMSGLDPGWQDRILNYLLDFKENGGSLIFSSHRLDDIFRLSDQVAVIHGGGLLGIHDINDLLSFQNYFRAVLYSDHMDAIKDLLPGTQVTTYSNGYCDLLLKAEECNKFHEIIGRKQVALISFAPAPIDLGGGI